MFSSNAQLQKRTPENGTDRENYLSLLVDEFIHSTSFDAKRQVLANLANFAYDPINFGYIRNVGVLDIFLYVIKKETCPKLLHFACAGISNLCIDPENIQYLLNYEALPSLLGLLKSDHSEIVADVITILIYLKGSVGTSHINTPEILHQMDQLKQTNNEVIRNLATFFVNYESKVN